MPADNVTDHLTWKEGDFALISSNRERFRVDAIYIIAAGTRLRDLVTAHGSEREIVFTHPIEDSTTVDLFLSILLQKRMPPSALGSGVHVIDRLRRLFVFMKTYDCDILRQTALTILHLNHPRLKPYQRFAVGASEGDLDLCVAALGTTALDLNLGRSYDSDGRFDLDPRSMPFSISSRIPPKHLWALTRAWDESNPNITARSGYHIDELVDLFESFYKIAQNAPPAPDYGPALDEVKRRRSQQARERL